MCLKYYPMVLNIFKKQRVKENYAIKNINILITTNDYNIK